MQTGLAPVINTALTAPAMKGYSAERIGAGDSGDVSADGTGAFRTNCSFSHFAFDDPIVYPGQPGKSHLHTFFGNSGLNSSSTVTSVASTGNSSCMGGTVNRTGYWIPALVNLKTGAPVVPNSQVFYYKSAYLSVKAADVQTFPAGLRIIAGDSSNKTPLSNGNVVRIMCQAAGDGAIRNYIPDCAVGATIEFMVMFPQCWDGVNLDSPDHKSHMAYATGSGCPSTHPRSTSAIWSPKRGRTRTGSSRPTTIPAPAAIRCMPTGSAAGIRT